MPPPPHPMISTLCALSLPCLSLFTPYFISMADSIVFRFSPCFAGHHRVPVPDLPSRRPLSFHSSLLITSPPGASRPLLSVGPAVALHRAPLSPHFSASLTSRLCTSSPPTRCHTSPPTSASVTSHLHTLSLLTFGPHLSPPSLRIPVPPPLSTLKLLSPLVRVLSSPPISALRHLCAPGICYLDPVISPSRALPSSRPRPRPPSAVRPPPPVPTQPSPLVFFAHFCSSVTFRVCVLIPSHRSPSRPPFLHSSLPPITGLRLFTLASQSLFPITPHPFLLFVAFLLLHLPLVFYVSTRSSPGSREWPLPASSWLPPSLSPSRVSASGPASAPGGPRHAASSRLFLFFHLPTPHLVLSSHEFCGPLCLPCSSS